MKNIAALIFLVLHTAFTAGLWQFSHYAASERHFSRNCGIDNENMEDVPAPEENCSHAEIQANKFIELYRCSSPKIQLKYVRSHLRPVQFLSFLMYLAGESPNILKSTQGVKYSTQIFLRNCVFRL